MLLSFASGTIHKEFSSDTEDFLFDANPYYKCSPEYGCPKMTWNVDLTTMNDHFNCPIFRMPSG